MNDSREQKVAAARARMAELAVKFIERTRDDLRTMRVALARAGAGDVAALAELRQLAHRLAGTGPTLGFAAVGERAAAAEDFIDGLPAGAAPDAPTLGRLAAALDAIEAQLEDDARHLR